MYRSRSLFGLAAAFVMAAAAVAVDCFRAVCSFAKSVVVHAVEAFAAPDKQAKVADVPAARLIAAHAMRALMAKRERPVVHSTWRMCPSS